MNAKRCPVCGTRLKQKGSNEFYVGCPGCGRSWQGPIVRELPNFESKAAKPKLPLATRVSPKRERGLYTIAEHPGLWRLTNGFDYDGQVKANFGNYNYRWFHRDTAAEAEEKT